MRTMDGQNYSLSAAPCQMERLMRQSSMRFRGLIAVLAAAALASVACGITTPADNDVDQVTGIIPVAGTDTKNFDARNNGEVQITVTSLVPTPSASLGMYIGQPSGTSCALIQGYLAPVTANRTAEFGYFNKGSYCVVFYDTGALTADTAYVANISHP